MNDKYPTKKQAHNHLSGMFDIDAARQERLDWRLGGELPTERALGIDETQKATVKAEIAERTDRRHRLDKRLGGTASNEMKPE